MSGAYKYRPQYTQNTLGPDVSEPSQRQRDELWAANLLREMALPENGGRVKMIADALKVRRGAEPSRGAPSATLNIHDRLVMGWLVSNAKTPDEVKWASYPIGMVQRWIERAQEAESTIGCVAPIPYAASGHVVLLEALRRCEQYIGGHKDENGELCIHQECNKHNFRLIAVLDQIRAAIQQAERT